MITTNKICLLSLENTNQNDWKVTVVCPWSYIIRFARSTDAVETATRRDGTTCRTVNISATNVLIITTEGMLESNTLP